MSLDSAPSLRLANDVGIVTTHGQGLGNCRPSPSPPRAAAKLLLKKGAGRIVNLAKRVTKQDSGDIEDAIDEVRKHLKKDPAFKAKTAATKKVVGELDKLATKLSNQIQDIRRKFPGGRLSRPKGFTKKLKQIDDRLGAVIDRKFAITNPRTAIPPSLPFSAMGPLDRGRLLAQKRGRTLKAEEDVTRFTGEVGEGQFSDCDRDT